MNILEIYRGHAWWFDALDETELWKLREVAAKKKNGSDRWHEGRLYFLQGDVATFNLRIGTFDEVRIVQTESAAKAKSLEKLARVWLKPGGVLAYGAAKMKEQPLCNSVLAVGISQVLPEPLSKCEIMAESVLHSIAPIIGSGGLI